MVVRPTTRDDHARVSALLAASYPDLMRTGYDASVLQAALPLMTQANPTLLSSGTYYVAESTEGHVIGCGGWTSERPGDRDIVAGLAHIRHFATHPAWTGRGIGRRIYGVCEEQARTYDILQFECYASLNAEGFYTSLGFEAAERLDVPMGPTLMFPSILMRRSI